MNRIVERLGHLKQQRAKALALFMTAGFPSLDSTASLVRDLEQAGADLIELGMPFSDPMADGPIIQRSSARALQNGMTLPRLLDDVATIREHSTIPLVLMGYVNPILRFGPERFFRSAREAGVDGFILPELPLEESQRWRDQIEGAGMSRVLLVAPTTTTQRMEDIDGASSGFVYCVSRAGVTGMSAGGPQLEHVRTVRTHIRNNPLLVGFGVSTPEQARTCAQVADGVIVGSALLQRLFEGLDVVKWVNELKHAMSE